MAEILAGAGGGGLMGLGKFLGDQKANESDKALNSVLAKWSPWGFSKPGATRHADAFKDITQGALGGANFGQKNKSQLTSLLASLGGGMQGPGAAGDMGSTDLVENAGMGGGSPWAAMAGMPVPV